MSKGKLLAVVVVWLLIIGILAAAWKFVISPGMQSIAEGKKQNVIEQTSSQSRYDFRPRVMLDSFSGYSILRSKELESELQKRSIKLDFEHDEADYMARLKKLKSGETDMAAFTIDALIKTSAQMGEMPASIVAILDETRGADAILGYKNVFSSVDDLNDPEVRFVLTPDSPSETLARVVMSQFNLSRLADVDPMERMGSADEVYLRYKNSRPGTKEVFVLWEPFVSQILSNEQIGKIISSAELLGYIVDVLVVNRDYLVKNREVVEDVVECYFTAAFQRRSTMKQLVLEDGKQLKKGNVIKQALTVEQSGSLVDGIEWKGTQHNYGHFGIDTSGSVQHIEKMIENITDVLISTGAIASDPTNGRPNLLYYDAVLKSLYDRNFHPAGRAEIDDSIRLPKLSESEWNNLSWGTLKDQKIDFQRGQPDLNLAGRDQLDKLIERLKTNRFYIQIQGGATNRGDRATNLDFAAKRARNVADYLTQNGVDANRIQTTEPKLFDAGTVPAVTFRLGQLQF